MNSAKACGRLLGHEAVADKDIADALFFGQAGRVLGKLHENGGFGVGVGDGGAAVGLGLPDDDLRRARHPGDFAPVSFGELGNVVVLAVEAHEVAAGRGDGVGAGPRQEVEQGLFLDGVGVFRHHHAVHQGIEGPGLVFPHVAEPPFARVDLALVGAQVAEHLAFFQLFVKPGLLHVSSLRVEHSAPLA